MVRFLQSGEGLVYYFQGFLYGLSNVYHALQQWEEARRRWEEAEAMTERSDLRALRVVILSQLCMNYTVAGQWGQAHMYAVRAMALRYRVTSDRFDAGVALKEVCR